MLLLLAGAFLAVAQRESWRVLGRRICFAVALLFFLCAIFPVGDWMLLPLENRFPASKPEHVDGIILVGEDENPELAAARGQPAAHFSADDYIVFASLARRYPQAKLLYTGGSGLIAPNPDLSNAEVARKALGGLGVPVEHMVFEDTSRNTYENAVKSAALVNPTKQQKWLLVTSAQHMPRTVLCFRKAGWNVVPFPASYITSGEFNTRLQFALAAHLFEMELAVHEYLGLVGYKLMGYTDELWPR